MPDLRIDNIGAVGLNTDIAPSLLPPNALSSARNVQMSDGSIQSEVGERLVFQNGAKLDVRPQYHISWIDASQSEWAIVSDGLDVWAYLISGDGTGQRITPTDDDSPTGNPVIWSGGFVSFAILNGVLVINSRTDGLFFWAGGASVLVAATGWDATWRCQQICAFRYQLVALSMVEGVNEYVHKIRWSNSAQDGSLPTDWTIALSNDAGDDLLGETEGRIVGGVNVRDQLYIIKEDAIYGLRYVGGVYINQVTRLEGGVGTRNHKGFCEMRGNLVVITTGDILLFDGQNTRSLADRRVRRSIFDQISEENWDNTQVFYNQFTSVLTIAYPTLDATLACQWALVYNVEEDTFALSRLNNSYGFDLGYVSDTAVTVPKWDDFGPAAPDSTIPDLAWVATGTWDEQKDGSWNKGVSQPSLPDTLIYESNDADDSWWISVKNFSNSNSDGSPKYCLAQRTGIPIEGARGIVQMNWVWPEINGALIDDAGNDVPIKFRFGSQEVKDGTITWSGGVFDVYPGQTETLDPRISGRYLCWEATSEGLGSWELSALTIYWESGGER